MKGPSFEDAPQGPGLHTRGSLDGQGLRIGVVASSFNLFVTSKLVEGACEGLMAHGFEETDLHVSWVPGAFELPLAAVEMARSGRWDALVCVGAVIRGETSHFDFVAGESGPGHCRRLSRDGRANSLWRSHHGHGGAGAGEGRRQSGQQGLRGGPYGH